MEEMRNFEAPVPYTVYETAQARNEKREKRYIAIILVVIIEAMLIIFTLTKFGDSNPKRRTLKVSIPEELDYTDIFDDLFEKYTNNSTLIKVKLKNLGTIFQLTYDIQLKDAKDEKKFIDEIRERNANLDILCSRQITNSDEL